jgi:hypothetical protein
LNVALDVKFSTSNGVFPATAGIDFMALPASVPMPAGMVTAKVQFIPLQDFTSEGRESVNFHINGGVGYTYLSQQNSVTAYINDNDQLLVRVAAVHHFALAFEGTPNTTNGFVVTRLGSLQAPLTVNWEASGTAVAGIDYLALPSTVSFQPGQGVVTTFPQLLDDSVAENRDDIQVLLKNGEGYTVEEAFRTAKIEIEDNDGHSVSVTATPSLYEDGFADFTITRTGNLEPYMTVRFTLGGTAVNGADYTSPPANEVLITRSLTTKTVRIAGINDAVSEADKTITLTISPSQEYTIQPPGLATMALLDNDIQANVEVVDGTAMEEGLATGQLDIVLSKPSVRDLTVNFTVAGTATSDTDYHPCRAARRYAGRIS